MKRSLSVTLAALLLAGAATAHARSVTTDSNMDAATTSQDADAPADVSARGGDVAGAISDVDHAIVDGSGSTRATTRGSGGRSAAPVVNLPDNANSATPRKARAYSWQSLLPGSIQ
jgi:hypothetical protein